MNCIARRVALRLWWLVAIAVVTVAAGAAADWRFAIVGLMILFIVYPMAMSLAILAYAAKPTVVDRMTVQTVDVTDSAITLRKADGSQIAEITPRAVTSITTSPQYIIISTGRRPDDVVILPRTILSDADISCIMTNFQPTVEM